MLTVDAAATDYVAFLRARHAPVATMKAYTGDLRRFVDGVPGAGGRRMPLRGEATA